MDPRIDPQWAESVRDIFATQGRELTEVSDRSQIEEALLADASLDWALVSYLLDGPTDEVRAALHAAARALLAVHALRGTSSALPVVRVDNDGLYVRPPAGDESLDSPERARTAYHLAGATQDPDLLAQAPWPGGPADEEEALAALRSADHDRFLATLDQILAQHARPTPDPRALVSVPALGLAGRARARGLVRADELPVNPALPLDLLGP